MSDAAEYLVHIEVHWPPDGSDTRRDLLMEAERARGQELVAAGVIRRLWRVPGRWANWGVWRAASPDELHAALASLPFFPWLDIEVIPLAGHPNDPG